MREPEVLIGRSLKIGVLLSLGVLVLGTLVSYFGDSAYLLSSAELERLHQPGAALPQTIADVLAGAAHLHGPSIISLGLLILIATPVVRVAVSIGIWLRARDWLYVGITSCVLLLLLLSFLIGSR